MIILIGKILGFIKLRVGGPGHNSLISEATLTFSKLEYLVSTKIKKLNFYLKPTLSGTD